MHWVYVLRSRVNQNFYIGCTSDLEQRLKSHEAGEVRSTKARRPLDLIYKEEYLDKYEAFKIERFYKTSRGKRLLKEKINNCRFV